jgi:hypothetical protein
MNDRPFCTCRGGHCGHHAAFEPCPNEAVEPQLISAIDMQSGMPITNSMIGLCQECWENHLAAREMESAG